MTDGGEPNDKPEHPVGGRDAIPPADVVALASVPEEDATAWAKLETDNHRLGGFWFPTSEDAETDRREISEQVDHKEDIPRGHLIHFPHDNREPEMWDGSEAPWWVNSRHVDATLGDIANDGEPEDTTEDERHGEGDMVQCDLCGRPSRTGGVTGEDHPEGPGHLACSGCLETDTDREAMTDGGRLITDGGEDVGDDDLKRATDNAVSAANRKSAHELMNLARYFHDRSREHREASRNAASEESAITADQIADAYADAADEARELARYLSGDREDRPPTLVFGEELSSGDSLPWDGQDSGDGGDGS